MKARDTSSTTIPDPAICHRCGALLRCGDGSFWVVRIESIADPSPPVDDEGSEIGKEDREDVAALIDQMRDLSEQELLDQVHRRMTLLLCARCHAAWIEDPAG